jgi:hypothetical protein
MIASDRKEIPMIFTAHRSDTDCDGTTYNVARIEADSIEQAWEKAHAGYYDVSLVEPEAEFFTGSVFAGLDDWHKDYYRSEGYASVGADWKPWAEDDSIGIPALDHTYDTPYEWANDLS